MTLIQYALDGLMTGAVYAIIALAFSLVWASMRTVNLALLQIAGVGAMAAYGLGGVGGPIVALLGAATAAALVALASYYVAIRPTLKRWRLIPIVATLGFGVLIEGLLSRFAGAGVRPMPPLLPTGSFAVGDVYVRRAGVVVLLVVIAMLAAAMTVLRRSKVGLAFRASSWSPEIAEANGVNIEAVRVWSTVASGVYAGIAGALIGVLAGSVSPFAGFSTGLKGIVAMLVGGAGNPLGAVVGGTLIGVSESMVGGIVSNAIKGVISFGVLLLVMLLRPHGIMQER